MFERARMRCITGIATAAIVGCLVAAPDTAQASAHIGDLVATYDCGTGAINLQFSAVGGAPFDDVFNNITTYYLISDTGTLIPVSSGLPTTAAVGSSLTLTGSLPGPHPSPTIWVQFDWSYTNDSGVPTIQQMTLDATATIDDTPCQVTTTTAATTTTTSATTPPSTTTTTDPAITSTAPPGATTTPGTTGPTPPTAAPTTVDSSGGGGALQPPAVLPATGPDLGIIVLSASVIATGVALTIAARRRDHIAKAPRR